MPILYFVLAAAVVVVDQVVKYLVRTSIPLHVSLSFLPGLDLTYLQNTGAAFSLFNRHTWVLALLSGVVVGGVLLCIHVIFTYSKEPKPEEKP